MTTLAILALSIVPALREPLVDTCAVIERNHFYSEDGRHVFTQVIFWQDELPYPNTVIAWRMADKVRGDVLREGNGWSLTFDDSGTLRKIRAASYRETWTQAGAVGDPEVNDRERLPQCERRELRKPLTKGT